MKRLRRWLRRTAIGLAVLAVMFSCMQVIPYGRTHDNPEHRIEPKWDSPRTRELAVRACFGCHSNETQWPWYSNVAPISWNVISHVNDGRGSMNFSNWPEGPEEAGDLLDKVCKEVKNGHMPIPQYTWMHAEATLTDADRKRLCDWANKAAGDLY